MDRKRMWTVLGVSVDEYWNKIKPEGDRKSLIHTAVVNDLYNKTGKKKERNGEASNHWI